MSTIQIYDGEKFVPFNISSAIEMPVGFEDYVSYTELDPGQLIRNGQLVSREIYSDLWNFVQSKPSMLLTEEEWQANLTANEGLACNYYSAGDGSTNFRLPKASVIVLPDPNPENINKYSTDTQRNILGRQVIGSISSYSPTNGDFVKGTTGAFYGTGRQYISNSVWSNDIVGSSTYINPDPTTNVPSGMNTGDTFLNNINFDASKSIGAEHTGNEVKPKTITKLPIVYAFGRIVNAGELDVGELMEYVKNLEKNSGYPLGAIYPTLYGNVDVGSLPLLGGEYTRAAYSDLWNLVQTKDGYVVTEAEWQELNIANDGNVPKFSSGDGSTTFRLPKITKFLSGVESINEVGSYQTDTQRNITGSIAMGVWSSPSGCFYANSTSNMKHGRVQETAGSCAFDASRSVGTEHTSNEVAPKHIKALYQIKVFGTISNSGNVDIVDYVNDNKSSMPLVSEVSRIIINLTAQGQSWTAPCDGYIFAKKIGDASVVNSWMNCWNAPNATDVTYGQLLYCDYGQPYINLCGQIPVAKGMTMYFNWSNNAVVYFYPTVNAHYNG